MEHSTKIGTPAAVPGRGQVVGCILTALSQVQKRDLTLTHEDVRLFDDLSLDSTSVLELLMELEDGLGLELDPDSLEQHHFETVGTLTDYLLTQLPDWT